MEIRKQTERIHYNNQAERIIKTGYSNKEIINKKVSPLFLDFGNDKKISKKRDFRYFFPITITFCRHFDCGVELS